MVPVWYLFCTKEKDGSTHQQDRLQIMHWLHKEVTVHWARSSMYESCNYFNTNYAFRRRVYRKMIYNESN
jgi:hypothetical protein